jgi:tetratricopeptide (TPR) repeat protein/tRNA A-37 threonylcarbamoyl transferase component Bud32
MSPDRPTAYEQLTLEEAAHVDAACDRLERAWKEARDGGQEPRLENYLDNSSESVRTVLLQELVALDRACRERYGLAVRPEDYQELGWNGEPANSASWTLVRKPAPLPSQPTEWPRIPGLELVEILGSGGMGVVFKARQATLNRDVAVKVLRGDHRTNSEPRERFLQEARAIARLRHAHLVQVYEFGEVPSPGGSRPYLVLEYVPGGSLADLLRGSPQPADEAARLVQTLAEAIHYAHQQGVVHRDLKPANVLLQQAVVGTLNSDVCAKITDFGLAKFVAGSDLTRSGDVLGTPSYMAPEQASGSSGPLLEAVDIYGLGTILYEALTGGPPFVASTVDATLALVRQEEPVPPRRLQPGVPRDLETICLKCLRKEPGRRYATARELADDLGRFRAGEPVKARPVGTVERVIIWCRRKPVVAGLLVLLLLVFQAGFSGILWQWQRASRNATQAEQNATAYRREWEIARQANDRAVHHLEMIRDRVDQLNRLGRDLLQQRGMYRTGQAILQEALSFYQEMLPEEGDDPEVRRQAARLFRQVADLHFTLGQPGKAEDAYGRQAELLNTLLEEDPTNKELCYQLADSQRWQGNLLRDQGKTREAREIYDQAAALQKELVREVPQEPRYQMALANTLLNMTTLLSRRDHVQELEPLYERILQLDQTAVRLAPNDPKMKAELALTLVDQGVFFQDTGRGPQAESAVRKALEIYQSLLAQGHLKGYVERYAARNYVALGHILAVGGKTKEAEQAYLDAEKLLNRIVEELPEAAIRRADLAQALTFHAGLLQDLERRSEAETIRRRVIGLYEALKTDFPEDAQYPTRLVQSYLDFIGLLEVLGRPAEAATFLHQALEVKSEDPGVNNNLAWILATHPESGLRNPALAVQLAQKAVAARQQSANCHNTLGVAHYRNGDNKAAVAELETACKLRPVTDPTDCLFLAMAYSRLSDRTAAQTWFDRAVQEMDKQPSPSEELRRFRAEAEAVMAATDKR